MYTVYFMFFQVASATATRYGLSRGLLGLKYDQINYSDSDSDSVMLCAIFLITWQYHKSHTIQFGKIL